MFQFFMYHKSSNTWESLGPLSVQAYRQYCGVAEATDGSGVKEPVMSDLVTGALGKAVLAKNLRFSKVFQCSATPFHFKLPSPGAP